MEFRILGPLQVRIGDAAVRMGGPRQRTLLALLLLRAGEVVASDRLAEDLWNDEPPATARHTLQTYLHRLRRALGTEADRLQTRPPGCLLAVAAGELDAHRFKDLAEQGRCHLRQHPPAAADLLAEALRLWRGPVLADLPDVRGLEPERARLTGLRLATVEDRVEADLMLGRHASLVGELEALVDEHPFRERLWGQLMVVLYRSGRQADALATYDRLRRTLAEEVGLDPSPELVSLQEQILSQDAALRAPEHVAPKEAEYSRDHLDRGRASYARRAWADAFQLLTAADQVAPLGAGDLEQLAASAFLVGRDQDGLRVLDRAHRAYLGAADTRGAVRCAFWLCMTLTRHRHPRRRHRRPVWRPRPARLRSALPGARTD